MAMGCWQCLSLIVVQLKGKHCWKPHCRNGVVDTFRQYLFQMSTHDSFSKIDEWWIHCKCFPHKNYSTENYGVPAGKTCKNHRETLCILRGNPVIFTDCGEIPIIITCILQGSLRHRDSPHFLWGKNLQCSACLFTFNFLQHNLSTRFSNPIRVKEM